MQQEQNPWEKERRQGPKQSAETSQVYPVLVTLGETEEHPRISWQVPPDFWTVAHKEERTQTWMRRYDSDIRFMSREYPSHPAWNSSSFYHWWMIRSGKALGDISVWESFSQCRWERHHHPMKYKVRRNNTGLRKVTAAGAVVKTWDDPGNCKGRAHPEGISQKNSKS